MYIYEFDLHVFYCIRSGKKIAKLIEQKLIFGYIIEELIGDETYSVCTYDNRLKILSISHDIDDKVIFCN